MNLIFLDLVRVSIGQASCLSHIPTENEWHELFTMARKQSLLGFCFSGVSQMANTDEHYYVGMSESLYRRWTGIAFQILRKNECLNEQCLELQKRFEADGYRSCILKGQGVARLYGELALLRQSGDIDIWVDAPKDKVLDYVMGISPTKKFDQKHIHFACFNNTDVEVHWSPVYWYASTKNKILQEYFDSVRDREFSNGGFPTLEFQMVHQLLHVYGHYVYEGVGLRQLMDLFFTQKAYCAEIGILQEDKVVELFGNLGLMKFVSGTQWALQQAFGLADDLLLCIPDEVEGRLLMDDILDGGNFGHYNENNHVKGESYVHRFFRRWSRKWKMIRFDPLSAFLMPIRRVALEIWIKKTCRSYGLK